jgi:hypothetical protein
MMDESAESRRNLKKMMGCLPGFRTVVLTGILTGN